MTYKQKKEEIKQVVTNLGNIEFTVEDELKFCKEVLKRKEQECEEWKNKYYSSTTEVKADLIKQLNQLKVELKAEKNKLFLPTCYEKLYKETKEMKNNIAKKCSELEKENKELKGKMTAQEINQSTYIKQLEKTINRIRTERDNYKQALQKIREIAETLKADICSYCDSKDTDRCDQTDTDELQQIINKCEVIND